MTTDNNKFVWTYCGKHSPPEKRFACVRHTKLEDDINMFHPGTNILRTDNFFFLDKVVGSKIHGYYFRKIDGKTIKVNVERTAGHVRACDVQREEPNDSNKSVTVQDEDSRNRDTDTTPTADKDNTPAVDATSDVAATTVQDGDSRNRESDTTPPADEDNATTVDAKDVSATDTVTKNSEVNVVSVTHRYSLRKRKPRKQRRRVNRKRKRVKKKKKKRCTDKSTASAISESNGNVQKKPKIKPPSLYKYGKYAPEPEPGELVDPTGDQSCKPLTKQEDIALFDDRPTVGEQRTFIYKVRGWRISDTEWVYEGKAYNSSKAEFLTEEWMDDNGMGLQWRERNLHKYERFWFRICVGANEVKIRGGCVPISIIKFYNHMDMKDEAEGLQRQASNGLTKFTQCTNFIYKTGGFTMKKIKGDELRNFSLITAGMKKILYVVQIQSVDSDTGAIDNTHAISTFDGKIFDANHADPLPLTRASLDECCLGGDNWIFARTSRVYQFTPGNYLLTTNKFFVT